MDCNKTQNDFLAVVGMACRFPGAASLEEFWENLLAGRQAMSPVSEQALNAGPHKNVWRLPGYVRMCCRLEDVEFFDPDFFGLSTAEAEIMDPQHRLLLETAWRALENSGDTRPDAEKNANRRLCQRQHKLIHAGQPVQPHADGNARSL